MGSPENIRIRRVKRTGRCERSVDRFLLFVEPALVRGAHIATAWLVPTSVGGEIMKYTRLMSLLPLLVAAGFAAAQPAANTPATAPESLLELLTKAREARLKGDVPVWAAFATRALALTHHPDVLISAARAHAAAGNKALALDYLGQAVRRGAGLDPVRFAEFKPLAADPEFVALATAARRNLMPLARAEVFTELPEHMSEGITFDPVSRRFFVSGGEGQILAIDTAGKATPFASGGGLRQLLGLKVDAQRRMLWLANGRYPEPGPNQPPDSGTGGIRAYNLDTGALVVSAELDERPLLHGFNDLALMDDGTAYVTDSNTHAVYKLVPGGEKLELVLRDDRMTYPNGIAPAPDGRTIYVAHLEGISALDPATRSRRLLPQPVDTSLHSIDGLLLHDGVFYGVQTSPYMPRLVAAALAPDGRSISKVWAVHSRDPAGYDHSTATIAGDHVYMVGARPLPDIYGGTNPAKPMPKIWRVPLKD